MTGNELAGPDELAELLRVGVGGLAPEPKDPEPIQALPTEETETTAEGTGNVSPPKPQPRSRARAERSKTREEGSRHKENQMNQQDQNPFWAVVDAVGAINQPRPQESQPEEVAHLNKLLLDMDLPEQIGVFHQAAKRVLDGEAAPQGLGPIAHTMKRMYMAYPVWTLHNMMVAEVDGENDRERGDITMSRLTVDALADFGLMEIRPTASGQSYNYVVHMNLNSMREAIPRLEEAGFTKASEVLRENLRQARRRATESGARRRAQDAEDGSSDSVEAVEAPTNGDEAVVESGEETPVEVVAVS